MRPEPSVLAFDTSAAHCAAALLIGGQVANVFEDMPRGQAERLMPMLAELLAQQGAGWGDLDLIGVGIGPGNFTGTRIAVAAARGLALALDVPAVGVTRFEALAQGQPGPVLASVAAPRGQVFARLVGAGPAQPELIDPESWTPPQAFCGAVCIGAEANMLAARTGGRTAAPALPLAVAIARIAGARQGDPGPKPAPLYLQPPDAALPAEPPPVILP